MSTGVTENPVANKTPSEKWKDFRQKGISFWSGEGIGFLSSMTYLTAVSLMPKKLIETVSIPLSKLIAPAQPKIEKVLSLSKTEIAHVDKDKPVDERAKAFSEGVLIKAIPAMLIGFLAKYAGRQAVLEHAFKVKEAGGKLSEFWKVWKWSPEAKGAAIVDELTNWTTTIAMNREPGVQFTNKLIDVGQSALTQVGYSKKDARTNSAYAVMKEGPGIVSGLAATAWMGGEAYYGWPTGRLRRLLAKGTAEAAAARAVPEAVPSFAAAVKKSRPPQPGPGKTYADVVRELVEADTGPAGATPLHGAASSWESRTASLGDHGHGGGVPEHN